MTKNTCKKLTIFEGVDGSGKTTAAKEYAERTGALYIHFPSLPRVNKGLPRMYIEAMLPALLGYQDVVFDRSWYSEIPYGINFRDGFNRTPNQVMRMLDRVAMKCGAVIVLCDPGFDLCRDNFMARKHLEMLSDDTQLFNVHKAYEEQAYGLPKFNYDYSVDPNFIANNNFLDDYRFECHNINFRTAGNINAPIIIIGKCDKERYDHDPWNQFPFVSFQQSGTYYWLTSQISGRESNILWIDGTHTKEELKEIFDYYGLWLKYEKIYALGDDIFDKVQEFGGCVNLMIPEMWRKINPSRAYPINY